MQLVSGISREETRISECLINVYPRTLRTVSGINSVLNSMSQNMLYAIVYDVSGSPKFASRCCPSLDKAPDCHLVSSWEDVVCNVFKSGFDKSTRHGLP